MAINYGGNIDTTTSTRAAAVFARMQAMEDEQHYLAAEAERLGIPGFTLNMAYVYRCAMMLGMRRIHTTSPGRALTASWYGGRVVPSTQFVEVVLADWHGAALEAYSQEIVVPTELVVSAALCTGIALSFGVDEVLAPAVTALAVLDTPTACASVPWEVRMRSYIPSGASPDYISLSALAPTVL
ncbi:MAG: hypothetical protein ACTHU0_21815 [Kofleriaceae bacterium]